MDRIAQVSLETFRSWPLPPDRYLLQHLQSLVNAVTMADFVKGQPDLTDDQLQYLPLLEHGSVHIGIFFCKQGASIPLHDHPGMCVFSKILQGKMQITSYDWDCDLAVKSPWPKPAKLSRNEVLGADDSARLLLPRKHNLHVVSALEDSAFLDIISPPYDERRVCTYYEQALAPLGEQDPERIFLSPAPWPEDFTIREVPVPAASPAAGEEAIAMDMDQ